MIQYKVNDLVFFHGQLAIVDFVFSYDGRVFKDELAEQGLAITILDTGDELMCGAEEVTLATNEVTELLYENNTVSEEPLDKT